MTMRTAYIGMGGNVASWAGAPAATLTAAAVRLETLGRVVGRSSLYSTAPVGVADQPRFVNAVAALQTDRTARALLEGLMGLEQEFGRDRSAGIANGPRTLDLDLLLLGDSVVREVGLEIPHPRLTTRVFVLAPLAEIAAQVVVPGSGKTVGELLAGLQSGPEAVLRIASLTWDGDSGMISACNLLG
jgi:2-amino-4-hydroxy-6-hydroxymethyldihydropteridine diphosphokinase